MPKSIFIESRNQTVNFPDDATQEEINAAIAEQLPRNGQDVAFDFGKFQEAGGDPRDFIANISDEDYVRLNNFRADQKLTNSELLGVAGDALGTIVGDAVKGVKAAFTKAGEGVIESAARGVGAGTVDLVTLAHKLVTPNQRIPTLEEFVNIPSSAVTPKMTAMGVGVTLPVSASLSEKSYPTAQDYKALIDQERRTELQSLDLVDASEKLIKGAPVPDVARGASYIDAITLSGLAKSAAKTGMKTLFKKAAATPVATAAKAAPIADAAAAAASTIEGSMPFVAPVIPQGAEAFAAKVGEGARKAGFTGVEFGAKAVKGTADLGKAVIDTANKLGLQNAAVRAGIGAAIGSQEGGQQGGVVGAIVGSALPVVARKGLAAVSGTADFIGAAAKAAKSGPSRTGIFEKMAQAADISPEARKFAEKVLFTQPFVQAAGEGVRQAAARAVVGAPLGAAIGYAADGEQGAAAGLGAGLGVSALGGVLDTSIDSIKSLAGKSTARSQRNAVGDIRSFVNSIPDDIARTGYAEVMDKAINLAGPERAADMLDNLRLAEAMGATVEVVPPSQRKKVFTAFDYKGNNGGIITINPDRMNAGSVAHETFHQLFNVGVKAELQQALRDVYMPKLDADGNVIRPGLFDDTEFAKRATELASRYKDNPVAYSDALDKAAILQNPAGYSPEAIDAAKLYIIDEMSAEYAERFMGRSRPGAFNPDRLPLWHRNLLKQIDDALLNKIADKVYADKNIKSPTAPFTDENGKPVRVPQLDSVLGRAFANKMQRDKGQTAGKIGKTTEIIIPTRPRDLITFASATFGSTRDVLGSDEQGNPRVLTDKERKNLTAADFDAVKTLYQSLPDEGKKGVLVTDSSGQPIDVNAKNAQIRITSQTPSDVFEQFLRVAKERGMGNQQIANMRQLYASMVANDGPTFNTVNNPVYKFNKRTGNMRAEVRPPTRQEVYPLFIHVNSSGGFNVKYLDMSRLKANAQMILNKPEYKGIWNGMDDFMADFKRSMVNLSSENPLPSAELLGNGNTKIGSVKRDLIAEAMNVTLPKRLEYKNQPVIDPLTLLTSSGKERRIGGSTIRDFRIERLTEVSPTNERLKVVEQNAHERIVTRFQPDAFAKEQLPNGEAMTNPDGYRVLKQAGGKLWRSYDEQGKLIGTSKTSEEAMKQAQADYAKKVMKQPSDKVVTIYHGTDTPWTEFDITKSADGTAWFTDNKKMIQSGQVAASGKGVVIERKIDTNKLKLGGWNESDRYSTDELISMGYDGLALPGDGETTYQIFFPDKLINPKAKVTKEEKQATKRFQPVSPEQDAAYLQAVKAGDTEKAQRMVDEETKAAGYDSETLFRGRKESESVPAFGRDGAHFTPDKEYADIYAEGDDGNTISVKARLTKPLRVDNALNESSSFEEFKKHLQMQGVDLNAKANLFEWSNNPKYNKASTINEALNAVESDKSWEDFKESPSNSFTDNLGSAVWPLGFDSIRTYEHGNVDLPVVIIKEANQIKSADPITYDDAGNVIPLSQRFNPESSDIRFQPDPVSTSVLNGQNGSRIVLSPSGKFRVYNATGKLLGIRDTEEAAKKLASKQ